MSYYNYEKAKQLRKQQHISLNLMSNVLGKDKSFLSRIENGKKNPNIELMLSISSMLNIPITDLLTEEKPMNMSEKYFLNFKRETLAEIGGNLEGSIFNYCKKHGIDQEDIQNPMVVLFNQIFDLSHNKIYETESKQELNEIEAYFKGVTKYIDEVKKDKSRAGI